MSKKIVLEEIAEIYKMIRTDVKPGDKIPTNWQWVYRNFMKDIDRRVTELENKNDQGLD